MTNNHELLSDVERTRLLWELFDALLRYLHMALTSGEPVKASMLDVARSFLVHNGISAQSRASIRRGIETLIDTLPFDTTDKN